MRRGGKKQTNHTENKRKSNKKLIERREIQRTVAMHREYDIPC